MLVIVYLSQSVCDHSSKPGVVSAPSWVSGRSWVGNNSQPIVQPYTKAQPELQLWLHPMMRYSPACRARGGGRHGRAAPAAAAAAGTAAGAAAAAAEAVSPRRHRRLLRDSLPALHLYTSYILARAHHTIMMDKNSDIPFRQLRPLIYTVK